MIEIWQWSFIETDCDECSNGKYIQLAGTCTGDSRFYDGAYIITSRIISSYGRSIVTQNGTHYLLKGEPSKYWVEDMELIGEKINYENPLGTFFNRREVSIK